MSSTTSPPWRSLASDGVSASVHAAQAACEGGALVLEFDLANTAGYAAATRQLPTTLPDDYEISFWMRGEAGRNHFEVKFVDASGDNVWWFRRANYQFSGDWQQVRIKRRQIEFAWGPTNDRTLRAVRSRSSSCVSAGRRGGKGSLWFDRLALKPLRAAARRRRRPSTRIVRSRAATARRWRIDGKRDDGVAQRAQRRRRRHSRSICSDVREFGGIEIDWVARAARAALPIETSVDGSSWQNGSHRRRGQRRARLASAAGVGSALHPPDDARSGPRRRHRRAARARPGVRRVAERVHQALAKQTRAAAAIRAAVPGRADLLDHRRRRRRHGGEHAVRGRCARSRARAASRSSRSSRRATGWLTWADVTIEQSLADGYLPIPSVRVEASPTSSCDDRVCESAQRGSGVHARDVYRVRNPTQSRQQVDAGARGAAVPGQSAGAVSEYGGRRQPDPGSRVRERRASTSMACRSVFRARSRARSVRCRSLRTRRANGCRRT